MKRFLQQSVVFLLGVGLLFMAFLYGSSVYIAKGDYFALPGDVTMLFMGHSHAACAYDDSIIEGSFNISQNTEGYPYTYFKLKKILEHNKNIRYVFVEFTNNQITPFAENRVSGSYLDVNMPRNFPVMHRSFIWAQFLQNKNPKRILSALLKGSKSNFDFLVQDENTYINSIWRTHVTPDRSYDPSQKVTNKNESPKPGQRLDNRHLPSENLRYLSKIVNLCKEEKVDLLFVRSPMPKGVKPPYEDAFQELLKSGDFSAVPFLDLKEYPLPNNMFADKQHLNSQGQQLFSSFFHHWISTGGLRLPDPQIDLKMQMERQRQSNTPINPLN